MHVHMVYLYCSIYWSATSLCLTELIESCIRFFFLNDHNMQVDISYMNISFGILNRNSMKNEMIFYYSLSEILHLYIKYKQQKTISEGFKKY